MAVIFPHKDKSRYILTIITIVTSIITRGSPICYGTSIIIAIQIDIIRTVKWCRYSGYMYSKRTSTHITTIISCSINDSRITIRECMARIIVTCQSSVSTTIYSSRWIPINDIIIIRNGNVLGGTRKLLVRQNLQRIAIVHNLKSIHLFPDRKQSIHV